MPCFLKSMVYYRGTSALCKEINTLITNVILLLSCFKLKCESVDCSRNGKNRTLRLVEDIRYGLSPPVSMTFA